MYLFDTDTITNLLKSRPAKGLLDKLAHLKPGEQFVSVITISEIVYGAYKSKDPDRHLKNLEEILLPNVNVVEYDSKAAYATGSLRAQLECVGRSAPFIDLQIASIAIVNNLCLVTGNTRHFKYIPGLKLENWLHG